MSKLYIGTSGFSYSYWKNRFYPEKLAAAKWLEYYSTQFNTVELNNTFYRFPTVKNLERSAGQVPADFKFTVKAHKIITHTRRMRDAKEKVIEFMDIVNEGLGDKLACVLFQLPPSYSFTEERMNDILESVEHKGSNVIEFRHKSWWKEDVYDILRKQKLSFCSVSYPGLPEDNILTSDVFYKRMHGVPELFKSSYSDGELEKLARHVPEAKECFVYFNNTMYEAGYTNAEELQDLMKSKR